ncbi:hypothetical protein [Bacillus solimangrovi]|uniref:Uncharacterized protein n=1 Tax=Bacillus solimangrovi TaxID=1305675 RepID=A0A1E5LJ23_9BACI|nr:hypothetical protein [Bacillus solimangrovi]OEH94093.1 hypothetical protein BFG57_09610 [Bacillus solimangrovi]
MQSKFVQKWGRTREFGKQKYMVQKVPVVFIITTILAFLLNEPYLTSHSSIGEWIFIISWYLLASFFISSFLCNLKWKINKKIPLF